MVGPNDEPLVTRYTFDLEREQQNKRIEAGVQELKDMYEMGNTRELERISKVDMRLTNHEEQAVQRFERLENTIATCIHRQEYDRRHDELDERLRNLDLWRANLAGRTVAIALMGAVLVAVISSVITHLVGSG